MAVFSRLFAIVLVLLMPLSCVADKKIDWNDAALTWHTYDAGLAKMQQSKAKGFVILYADWCPNCKLYSKLFANKKVVSALDGLVLIRGNVDNPSNADWLVDYDGGYVPKTIALTSAGTVSTTVYQGKEDYMFYFDPDEGAEKLIAFINKIKASVDR